MVRPEGADGFEYDRMPVLPNEALDLATHVYNCTLRHNALTKQLRLMRWEGWLYRSVTLGLLSIIAWWHRELLSLLPLFRSGGIP